MFQAFTNFLSSNQFGKSYSDIDREEQAALELQAQASTATTLKNNHGNLADGIESASEQKLSK